jgi:hypothetical protein
MTEAGWLAGDDARAMLGHLLHGAASRRKLRLLACAVCRGADGMASERGRRAVELAERFADRAVFKRAMSAARAAARGLPRAAADNQAWRAAALTVAGVAEGHAVALLRDVFGNPFRPVSVDPARLTPLVSALAAVAYEERSADGGLDADRLAVLADALEDAGCVEADLLAHLRGPGPHVRGCWALDLILGKQ